MGKFREDGALFARNRGEDERDAATGKPFFGDGLPLCAVFVSARLKKNLWPVIISSIPVKKYPSFIYPKG